MRALVQRVSRASVTIEGERVASIGSGMLILLGVERGDTEAEAKLLAGKISTLRIFEDAAGKMNLSLAEVAGEMLVVSQFTLAADLRRGRRPSFDPAAPPEEAVPLYESFCQACRELGVPVQTGRFAAYMQVELVNDGPVTLWLDSKEFR